DKTPAYRILRTQESEIIDRYRVMDGEKFRLKDHDPAMTAHRAVFVAGPVQGKTLLVTGGAGAVGHYALQLASWAGATVIATVSSPEKAERACAGGAGEVINYRLEDVAQRVLDITGGIGVDHIVEVDFGGNLAA